MQQVQRGADVVEVIFQRIRDGFADVTICGEMHDDLDFLGPQNAFDRRFIAQIDFVDGHGFWNGAAMAINQIIDDERPVSGGDQLANTMTADITGASDDENVHDKWVRTRWIASEAWRSQ